MITVLEERGFPVEQLIPMASTRTAGSRVDFDGHAHVVKVAVPENLDGAQIVLMSAGGEPSRSLSPQFVEAGAVVIDNSSAWRMDPDVPLVVPEVNPEDIAGYKARGIIANPNCSTIQMVVALKPLHDEARLKRVVVATYQAISGSGATAVAAFEAQEAATVRGDEVDKSNLSGQLSRNLLMHWKPDPETGYQEEELKMVSETRKIFGDPSIAVSPTAVRVPVITAHSEAITVETHEPLTAERARELLSRAEGVEVVDDLGNGIYPQPIDAAGRDPVYVGRIREDVGNRGGIQMWVVSDNLRKGAALNAVQIAEKVLLK
jgi:aspartate-semialdehyde dehydrogenase